MKAIAISTPEAHRLRVVGPTGNHSIDHLDLGPIKVKLMRPDGENWSVEQVNAAEKWYKRFLALNLKYPSASNVPTKAIDTFWHYHILDTQKYSNDCQAIFGYFLHHFPYFGMRGDEDAKNLEIAFTSTRDRFLHEFSESVDELKKCFPSADTQTHADCEGTECGGTACGATNCDGNITARDFNKRPIFTH